MNCAPPHFYPKYEIWSKVNVVVYDCWGNEWNRRRCCIKEELLDWLLWYHLIIQAAKSCAWWQSVNDEAISREDEHLSSCLWGFGEGSNANAVDVMENYAGSTELHTERNRKQECLHRRDEKWKSGFREGWKLFVNFNANLQMSQHLQKFWFVARFISKGGLAMTGASEILALPKLALSPPPTPQSWHTGGFRDIKCINATRDNH